MADARDTATQQGHQGEDELEGLDALLQLDSESWPDADALDSLISLEVISEPPHSPEPGVGAENCEPPAEAAQLAGEPALVSAPPARKRRWWPWVALLLFLAAIPGVWFGGRSEAVCGPLMDEVIQDLTGSTGLRVQRGAIAPHGWTGLEVRALEVRRPGEEALWFGVERVLVEPDVGALLDGELRLTEVKLSGVRGDLKLGRGERGDLALVRGLAAATRGRPEGLSAAPVPQKSGVDRSRLWSMLPAVRLERAQLRISDLDGRFDPLQLDSERLTLTRQDQGATTQLAVSGDVEIGSFSSGALEAQVALPGGHGQVTLTWPRRQDLSAQVQRHISHDMLARARVLAGGVTVTWPPTATLHDLRVEQIDVEVPWVVRGASEEAEPARPHIQGFSMSSVKGVVQEDQASFSTTDAVVEVALPGGQAPHPVPLGHARVEVDPHKEELRLRTELQGQLGLGSVHATWGYVSRELDLTLRVSEVPWAPYAPLVPAAARRHLDLQDGRVSGTLVLDLMVDQGLADLHSDMTLSQGRLHAPLLAEQVLEEVNLQFKTELGVDAPCRCVWLRQGQLRLGGLQADVEGEVFSVRGGWQVKLDVKTPRLDAQQVLASLPRKLAPALEGYQLKGEFDAGLSLRVDTRAASALRLEAHIDDSQVEVVHGGSAVDFALLKDEFSMVARGLPDAREVGDLAKDWTPYEELPQWLPQAIACAEDGKFWTHEGFDVRGIHRALIANIEQGRIARGGSTISQQVIKNLFLNHNRTLGRKMQEAFLTWHMEQVLSKERIMEIYLNMLHLGPGVYGVREASRVIFDKIPSRLSLRESAFLGSILPNPDYFVRLYAQDQLPQHRLQKIRNVLFNMHRAGHIGPRTYARAATLTDEAVISIAPLPRHLPEPLQSSPHEDNQSVPDDLYDPDQELDPDPG